MNINGKCRIFAKIFDEKIAYSTTISRKTVEGKYMNMFVQVQLPKETILDDKTDINITKGFITYYESKDGKQNIKFVIQEFEEIKKDTGTTYDLPF